MFFVKSKDVESLYAPVDIFVDIVIGFLEKSTSYLRAVGNQVFSLLSSVIQESTVDLILTVRYFTVIH
jgi:DNA polymerase phi